MGGGLFSFNNANRSNFLICQLIICLHLRHLFLCSPWIFSGAVRAIQPGVCSLRLNSTGEICETLQRLPQIDCQGISNMVCEPCAILAPHAFTPDNIGEAGTEHLALWKLFSSRREFMVLSGDGRLIYAGLGAKVSLGPFCRPFFYQFCTIISCSWRQE